MGNHTVRDQIIKHWTVWQSSVSPTWYDQATALSHFHSPEVLFLGLPAVLLAPTNLGSQVFLPDCGVTINQTVPLSGTVMPQAVRYGWIVCYKIYPSAHFV